MSGPEETIADLERELEDEELTPEERRDIQFEIREIAREMHERETWEREGWERGWI